ncbi:MAG: bifunctional pyr operon transcriptional regulator/uracil phosphoribosyltransferase PyrR [Myxococcales bacterium]|nr:MAG: bifunctional pyr operon transcriptional regulator/uracil phosphoribosyltransferase PyrR [Myxococcales bacterium]
MDAKDVLRSIQRMAMAIVEQTHGPQQLALVGVRRGGVPIATWMAEFIRKSEGLEVPVGTVDISLYRDDAASALPDPKIGPSHVPFDIKGKDVVLVDDVLHTGRTIRAAIECLLDYGRPRRIWLAVLCDRGARELPIMADFVGREVKVPEGVLLDACVDSEKIEDAFVRLRNRVG